MEKERLKIPYDSASVDILKFSVGDIIATSGGSEEQDDGYSGPTFSGSDSWT